MVTVKRFSALHHSVHIFSSPLGSQILFSSFGEFEGH